MGKVKVIADLEIVKFIIREGKHIHPSLDVTYIRSIGTESHYHEIILESAYFPDDMSNLYELVFEDHYYGDGSTTSQSFTTWKLKKQ
jgi:hypothetical protein